MQSLPGLHHGEAKIVIVPITEVERVEVRATRQRRHVRHTAAITEVVVVVFAPDSSVN